MNTSHVPFLSTLRLHSASPGFDKFSTGSISFSQNHLGADRNIFGLVSSTPGYGLFTCRWYPRLGFTIKTLVPSLLFCKRSPGIVRFPISIVSLVALFYGSSSAIGFRYSWHHKPPIPIMASLPSTSSPVTPSRVAPGAPIWAGRPPWAGLNISPPGAPAIWPCWAAIACCW